MSTSHTLKEEELQQFKRFIEGKSTLIIDPNSAAAEGMNELLIDLGTPEDSIHVANDYTTAEEFIHSVNPNIIIAEYQIGKDCSLNLIQEYKKIHGPNKESFFLLVTENTSQVAVAHAAEEDVDSYILKPYTPGTLIYHLVKSSLRKVYPDAYAMTIQQGKKMMEDGQIDQAKQKFSTAKDLHPKPTLALSYHGDANVAESSFDPAQLDFVDGLKHNSIHYRCLNGLYDLLIKQSRMDDAYEVVKRLFRSYPNNSDRLVAALRLAVITESFEDIVQYYQAFLQLKKDDPRLRLAIGAGLIVSGRHYMSEGNLAEASQTFKLALDLNQNSPPLIKEIVYILVEYKILEPAKALIAQIADQAENRALVDSLHFLTTENEMEDQERCQQLKQILSSGVQEPIFYHKLIQSLRNLGNEDEAKTIAEKAKQLWPKMEIA